MHETEGVGIAQKILTHLNYDPKKIPDILSIIDGHDTRPEALSLNARLPIIGSGKPFNERGGEMKKFADKAYDLLRKVPAGRVTTYREIAHALGTKAYRGVGQAMKRNPYAPEVP